MDFSDQFPVLKKCTYLNTANSGILSNDLSAWRTAHDEDFLLTGSLFRSNKDEFLQTGRNTIADFFNCYVGRTYLVPNFSHGFNVLLAGLDQPKHFLLLKEDYPSISYPVRSRGHQYSYIEIDAQLEVNILDTVERLKPDILALSLVQYSNGIKIDLDFLRLLKVKYPELIIVADGTQFCGTAPFDFENSGIDVLIASGYKWLLGGYGNGFVLLTKQASEKLYINEKRASLPAEGFLNNRNTLSLYFEPGHLDTLNFGSLFNAVTYLQDLGIENVANRICQVAFKARQAFIDRDLLSAAVKNRKDHSNIFNLMLPSSIIRELQGQNIIFSSRGMGIRVSFHFYNSEQDLKKLLEIIDR
ncbi:aminotransferase class V-fold PLP-dependent enzyme [Mucilaginibacter jinjuensis]|uniref:Aminotransferase class V-fold PLP-dependent enzyme n=1 Tax=Mucilaginibacter jinjuensis TaxID=1176721 RepID=A0ABY7TC36_9SPHI|nr:aminotransferase class V-fold PLP-dependent enzyme [Mucilaginibacter jinjuensis]WCT13268.1 aminotransferase class V-fold PLP-dependent enzyme [Mucilaginibacter jinjuensis]